MTAKAWEEAGEIAKRVMAAYGLTPATGIVHEWTSDILPRYGEVYWDIWQNPPQKIMALGGNMWMYLTGKYAERVVGPLTDMSYLRPLDTPK